MVWRAYYTLKDAAAELSREFNDTYTENDLIHYGALGLADFCISVPSMCFFKRSLAELYYLPRLREKPLIVQYKLFSAEFAPVSKSGMREVEALGSVKISVFPHLIDFDGNKISASLGDIERIGIHSDFENFELRIPILQNGLTESFETKTILCKSPQDVINQTRLHYEAKMTGMPDIVDFENDGWFYQFIPESSWSDFVGGLYPDRNFLEGNQWNILVNSQTLQIMAADFELLKNSLRQKMQLPNGKQTVRAENKQAEIIAALARLYTETDCTKPYEAAETIRQEWERNVDKLGNPPTNDTLAKYIKQGIDRLSQ